jgi:hypothetical protein
LIRPVTNIRCFMTNTEDQLNDCKWQITVIKDKHNQWRTQEFCLGGGGGSTNSFEDRGQRGRKYGYPPSQGFRSICKWVKPVFLLGCYGCIFHGTGNSAQLCQNFGISGWGVNTPNPPRYATEPNSPDSFVTNIFCKTNLLLCMVCIYMYANTYLSTQILDILYVHIGYIIEIPLRKQWIKTNSCWSANSKGPDTVNYFPVQ